MKNKKDKFSKGFTLIELIVVIAVFLFVVGAAINIFISIVQSQKRVLSQQQLLNQISYVEEYMSKALRMAKAATTSSFDSNCLGQDNLGYIYLLTRPYFDSDSGKTFYKGIKFLDQTGTDSSGDPLCQEFFLDNTTDPSRPVLKELKNSANDADAVALTSNSLQISFIRFAIDGSDGSSTGCASTNQCGASETDSVQPRVTILLNVKIAGDAQSPLRTIQTTVSQRNLNVK